METGGALIWALGPERKVYFDGRGDLHARAGTWHEMVQVGESEKQIDFRDLLL